MSTRLTRTPRRREAALLYLEALPGVCVLRGLGRRVAIAARVAFEPRPGSRTGRIHADVDASVATVLAMMATFEGDASPGSSTPPVRSGVGVVIREFETRVSLPLGITRVVRTREEIQLRPPDAIEFHHLAGPVRAMAEVIVVEPLGASRCRVTYTGELPHSGPMLRVAYRLLARPAIERIVRMHLADLGQRAERDAPDRGDNRSDAFGATRSQTASPDRPTADQPGSRRSSR